MGVIKGIKRLASSSWEEHKRRVNRPHMPCDFSEGISRDDFKTFAFDAVSTIKGKKIEISIDEAIIRGLVQSNTGLSTWMFSVDFNDYGHITGTYWLKTENDDSPIPYVIGDRVKDAIKKKLAGGRLQKMEREYYCPNCGADLTEQDGFKPSEGRWICTECGTHLYDEQYEGNLYKDVIWYCDKCGAFLNKQPGFDEMLDKWTCVECGHTNFINDKNIFVQAKQEVDNEVERTSLSDKEIIKLLKKVPFPKGYQQQKVPNKFKRMGLFPDASLVYGVNSGEGSGLITFMTATEEASMSFDNPQKIINELHETLTDNQGLIEVNCGVTRSGHRYAYDIFKIGDEEDELPIVSWILNLNVERDDVILFVNASYREEGTTGARDTLVYALLRNQGILDGEDMEGWTADPYDAEYKKGFLMNMSEKPEFDAMFPNHPLSMIRDFIKFVSEEW
jgi:ribosomal protein L37AE/L43A